MGRGLVLAVVPLIPAAAAGQAETLSSYYDLPDPPRQQSGHRSSGLSSAPRTQHKGFITDGDAGRVEEGEGRSRVDHPHNPPTTPGTGTDVALPPNMERGVKDIEEGMDDLRRYTATMAKHIQANGLRGFLAVPGDIKDQGAVVGRRIGSGIGGIATDTGREMISPVSR